MVPAKQPKQYTFCQVSMTLPFTEERPASSQRLARSRVHLSSDPMSGHSPIALLTRATLCSLFFHECASSSRLRVLLQQFPLPPVCFLQLLLADPSPLSSLTEVCPNHLLNATTCSPPTIPIPLILLYLYFVHSASHLLTYYIKLLTYDLVTFLSFPCIMQATWGYNFCLSSLETSGSRAGTQCWVSGWEKTDALGIKILRLPASQLQRALTVRVEHILTPIMLHLRLEALHPLVL